MIIAGVYEYLEGNIVLNIPIPEGLPKFIQVGEHQLLLKTELHITLINTSRTALLIDKSSARTAEIDIINSFKQFIANRPLENYKLLKDFRFVQRDNNKTVVALAYVDNLKVFFDELRAKYKKDIPDQPTHVKIYTIVPSKCIGLNSKEVIEQDSKAVEIKELKNMGFVKENQSLDNSRPAR